MSNIDKIIKLLQENDNGQDWRIRIGYISGFSEIDGKTINSGRDGESFTDEEKEKLKSFNDSYLSGYADNPIVYRKKVKNPYQPDSYTNTLLRYTVTEFKWNTMLSCIYNDERTKENEAIRQYIDTHPEAVAEYKSSVKNFDEKYNAFKTVEGNECKSENDFIYETIITPRAYEKRNEFTRIPSTPFSTDGTKYILNAYIPKFNKQQLTNEYRYFTVSPDGTTVNEISKEQAKYVANLFKSTGESKKPIAEPTALAKYAEELRSQRSGIWCNYSVEAMPCIEVESVEGGGFELYNPEAIVRISKASESKTSPRPEIYTKANLFESYLDKSK